MADEQQPEENQPILRELTNELTRAYLSGDGAAVEQVLAKLAEVQAGAKAA
jgi:hypothetical protein